MMSAWLAATAASGKALNCASCGAWTMAVPPCSRSAAGRHRHRPGAAAVLADARQQHAYRQLAVRQCQGVEEAVDGAQRGAAGACLVQEQEMVFHLEQGAGRDHVHLVGVQRGRVLDHLHHGHGAGALQQVGEHAGRIRRQVQHDHDGKAGLGRQSRQQALQGFQSARRRTDADQRKSHTGQAHLSLSWRVWQVHWPILGLP
jgi:hypothetical protein